MCRRVYAWNGMLHLLSDVLAFVSNTRDFIRFCDVRPVGVLMG